MSKISLPELPLAEWQDTLATLHMWSQIVGKIALEKTPLVNHFWNTTLRVTPRGLTTLPLNGGTTTFTIDFYDKHPKDSTEIGRIFTGDSKQRECGGAACVE